jgi:hypothetical protein
MARRGVATDPATQSAVLQRAAEIGDRGASDEYGIPVGTIRSWRSRGKTSATAADVGKSSASTRSIDPGKGAERTWRVAEAAVRKALELIESGDMLGAQRAMITAGIAADKTGQLGEAAGRAEEREARLSVTHGATVAAVLVAFLDAVDLAPGSAARAFIRDLLGRAGRGEPIAASPDLAGAAARELRQRIRAEVRAEIDAERPALPAGDDNAGRCDITRDRADSDAGRAREIFVSGEQRVADVEVVDAEVVSDPPSAFRVGFEPPDLTHHRESVWRAFDGGAG